ncbi:MAG: GNAT family N-acetyltransferase [Armatimonadota bacterium]|nr:GNAT family N-acetyltransferase [Armatimonadota bacterium]
MSLWCDLQGRGTQPYVIVARRSDAVVGIAPLVRVAGRLGPIAVRTVRFMGGGVGADHLDFVVEAAGADETRALLVTRLLDDAGGWDVAELLRASDRLAASVARVVGARPEFHCAITEADASPVLSLPSSWDELARRLPSGLASRVAYYDRRLRKDHRGAAFEQVDDPTVLPDAWEDLVRLHGSRWGARGRPGAFAEPLFATFHRRFAERALSRGWLRFYRLRVAGQCVAALYCLSMAGRVSFIQGGFDPAWQRYSVGTMVVAYAIKQAIAEGAREFDFLRGVESYKMRWTTHLRKDMNVVLVPRRLRSAAAVAWQRSRSRIGTGIRRVRRLVGR